MASCVIRVFCSDRTLNYCGRCLYKRHNAPKGSDLQFCLLLNSEAISRLDLFSSDPVLHVCLPQPFCVPFYHDMS